MRKVLVIAIATAALLGATVTADAQYNHRRHNGGGGGYHHHRGGGGGWVAPLVGGLLLGGAIYGLSQPSYAPPYQPYYRDPICRDVIVGRDSWNRPVYQTICE